MALSCLVLLVTLAILYVGSKAPPVGQIDDAEAAAATADSIRMLSMNK
ncbi:MAG TPA: hypothetical protein VH475_24490 [Tepidisphaeraceae bacterium]